MATSKFQTQSPYSQQAAELNRRQKLAELLQQKSMQPLQSEMVSGKVIPINPLAGLVKVLDSYTSARQLSDLDKRRAALETSDIQNANEMASEFRRRSVDQPIEEGDNTLRELGVRPVASSVPGKEYRTEIVEPSRSLAERQQSVLPAAIGAGVGPYQQKLAEMLYTEKPEAPKGAFAPINMKDVDQEKSNISAYQRTGDPQYLVMRSPEAKLPQSSQLSKLIDERSRLPVNDPNRKFFDDAIAKLSQAPSTDANTGIPGFDRFTPESLKTYKRTGNESDLVERTPAAEKLKFLPQAIASAFNDNKKSLSQIDRALKLNDGETITLSNGDVLVGSKEATGFKGYTPQDLLNRKDPEGIITRAEIANIGSMIIHDRSGAAVSASEAPRLLPFIPAITDNNDTVKKKLKLLRAAILDEDSALRTIYSEEQGYRPFAGNTQTVPDGFVIEGQ